MAKELIARHTTTVTSGDDSNDRRGIDASEPHAVTSKKISDDEAASRSSRSPEKRRLPVIQASAPQEDADAPERPPWHWIPIGATATFLVWLPLAVITERGVRHVLNAADARGEPIAAAGLVFLIGQALAFATGAFAAGVLVGRLGAKITRREPSLGGALAAAIAWLIAANQGTPGGALVWGLLLAILCAMGATFAALGGAAGQKWQRASSTKRK